MHIYELEDNQLAHRLALYQVQNSSSVTTKPKNCGEYSNTSILIIKKFGWDRPTQVTFINNKWPTFMKQLNYEIFVICQAKDFLDSLFKGW